MACGLGGNGDPPPPAGPDAQSVLGKEGLSRRVRMPVARGPQSGGLHRVRQRDSVQHGNAARRRGLVVDHIAVQGAERGNRRWWRCRRHAMCHTLRGRRRLARRRPPAPGKDHRADHADRDSTDHHRASLRPIPSIPQWTQTGSPKRFGQTPSRVRPAFDCAEIRRLFRRRGWRSGRSPGTPGRGRNGRTFTNGPPAKPGDPGERADCDRWWIRLRLRGRSCLLSGSSRSTVAVGRSSIGPARRHHRVLAGGPAAYGPLAGNASVGEPIASAMTARKSRTL